MCLTTGCFFLFRALCVSAVFFFLFFQLLWELKGFVICDLWFVGIKGFCVFFFAVNLVAVVFLL